MRNTVDILGVPIDNITMEQALLKVKEFLSDGKSHAIYTPNSEFIMNAQRDEEFKNILCQSDLCIPDGAGVVLASKILGRRLCEKVSGIDLVKNSFSMMPDRKLKYFFLGSKPGVAETAARNVMAEYKNVEVVGCMHGYFSKEEEPDVVKKISESNADILLVALGQKKQEKFIHDHKDELNVKVSIGVGGTINILAGEATLAPDFFRRNGLEWFYRLCKEPKRFVRMLDLPRFMIRVIKVKLLPSRS
mgnify:CR=1 FL=1